MKAESTILLLYCQSKDLGFVMLHETKANIFIMLIIFIAIIQIIASKYNKSCSFVEGKCSVFPRGKKRNNELIFN